MRNKITFTIFLILLIALLAGGLYVFINNTKPEPTLEPTQNATPKPTFDDIYSPRPIPEDTPTTTKVPSGDNRVPPEYTSGESRFSRGTCQQDSDCQVGGCSSEVCSSEDNIMSTCEYSEDFPGTDSHRCGCYNNACGWKPK